jgi:hypothetical protein
MGKLHNRRRTRLRPNKKAHHQAIAIPPPSNQLMSAQAIVKDDIGCYQQSGQYIPYQDNTSKHSNGQHEVRHTQYYGVEEGDESGDLCPLMLQVVLDLFDGVDYEDP